MHSSEKNKSNSLRDALFDATVQLSVPTATSMMSTVSKTRAYSIGEEGSKLPPRSLTRSGSRLSTAIVNFPRRSDLIKPQIVRNIATQTSPITLRSNRTKLRPSHLDLVLDNNNNPTTVSTISETSKEYLCVPRYNRYQTSPTRVLNQFPVSATIRGRSGDLASERPFCRWRCFERREKSNPGKNQLHDRTSSHRFLLQRLARLLAKDLMRPPLEAFCVSQTPRWLVRK